MSAIDDYDSGPFCRHWSDPSDCTEPCVCGHECRSHPSGEECFYPDCNCEKFTEPEENP